MASNINIRIKIRLTVNEHVRHDFIRFLSVSDSITIGDLMDRVNDRLLEDNMEGDIYYVFDEQLDNPFNADTLLGSPLFPSNLLLLYTMIENGSTLFIEARLIANVANVAANANAANVANVANAANVAANVAANAADAADAANAADAVDNQMRVYGRIYVQETGERLNDMILNIPPGNTVAMLINYINTELSRQYLECQVYHMANEEGFQIGENVRLGTANYPLDSQISDVGINDESVLYLNCRIINPFFYNIIHPPQNIQYQIHNTDLNSLMDIYEALMNINHGPNVLDQTINSLNSLNTLVQVLMNPVPIPVLGIGLGNGRMEDVIVGLDRADLDKLRVAIYTDFEERDKHDRDMCSVCFEKFIDSDICRELKCKHLYHQNCIDTWLDEHITCPVCREECGKGVPRL